MTNLIIKGHRYRLIDNKSFEMPLPLRYVVLKEDNEIAKYEIAADESVSCTILTKYKEEMITPITRPLTISDVYYFFSCRVFQDKTPYTYYELSQLGLEKYNVYNIIRKTRGITPYDTYWIRFEGDCSDYGSARRHWEKVMSQAALESNQNDGSDFAGTQTSPEPESMADVNEILNQKKIDVAAKVEEHAPSVEEDANVPKNSTMSADEIEQLLIQSGLSDAPAAPAEPAAPEPSPASSGGNLSPEEIEKLLAAANPPAEPEPAPAPAVSSGGNLSPDEIAKLFAANDTPAAPEPKPAASSGGNLSPDEIAKLFAANDAPAAPEPAPEPKPAASSGGNLSPDEIAKLFAANDAPAAPEPAPEPKPAASSGGNLSPDEIAKLFAATDTPAAPEPAPEPEPKPAASSGGNLSPDEIAKLFAANDTPAAPEPAPEPEPAPAASSGGNLSPDEIAKLFAANDAPAAPEPAASSGGKMSQEDIEKMLNEQVNAVSEPIDINAPADGSADNAAESAEERLSPEEIESLLGDMKKDAQT